MRVSDKGLLEIAEHEGIVPAPYKDSVGVWTFGIGHTALSGNPPDPQEMGSAMPTTDAELRARIMRAMEIFRADIRVFEDRVNKWVNVPLEQHEFDALVSFDFNTGGIRYRSKRTGLMTSAVLVQALNRGEPKAQAARHFMGWLKPPEIRGRREAEMKLFLTGDYSANGDRIGVFKTDGRGNLRGHLKTMSGGELLAFMQRPAPPDHVPVSPPAQWWAGVLEALRRAFGS